MKIIAMLTIAAATSCGKKDSTETATGKVNLTFKSGATSLAGNGLSLAGNGTFDDLPISTATTADGMFSVKMYFREIKLCTSLKFSSGSGYTIDGTCASVYTNFDDAYTGTEAPTAADRTRFEAAGEGKFYDVLSATDRAKLNRAVAVAEGEYNWGIIETHPWIKMVGKSGTICTTKAGAKETFASGGDGVKTYHTEVTSLDCPATGAEEVLTYITNANTTFKFHKPFTIKKDEEFMVDLAFNLDSEFKAIKLDDYYVTGNLKAADAKNSFYAPMIRIGAAPRKAAETTKVETYILGGSTLKEQIRLQLYYNSADTSKSILGINATALATATSAKTKANTPIYLSTMTVDGTTLKFKTWDGTDSMTMTRGEAGTAQLACTGVGGGASLEECSGKTTLSLSYDAPVITDLN